jgi:hypothetical protein
MKMIIAYLVFFGLYLLSPEFKTRYHRRRSLPKNQVATRVRVAARLYIEPYSTQPRWGKRFVVRKLSGEWPRDSDLIMLCQTRTGRVEAFPQSGRAVGKVELSMFASVRFVTVHVGTRVRTNVTKTPRQPWT